MPRSLSLVVMAMLASAQAPALDAPMPGFGSGTTYKQCEDMVRRLLEVQFPGRPKLVAAEDREGRLVVRLKPSGPRSVLACIAGPPPQVGYFDDIPPR